jgi:hypothetical protein
MRYVVCSVDLGDCPFEYSGSTIFPQRVAADVNCTGVITSYDAALILEYVVGGISAFPCAVPWAFYALVDSVCTYGCPGRMDWIGVLTGDLTGPPDTLTLAGGEPVIMRLGEAIHYDDRVDIPILVEGAYDIYSSQLDLAYDAEDLYVISVASQGLASGSMSTHRADGGILKIAMAGTQSYGGDGEIAVMTFGKNNPVPEIGDRVMLSTAMFNEGYPPVEIGGPAGIRTEPSEFGLGPVVPNPFSNGTVISYSVGTSGRVNLSIYNVSGQLVRSLIDRHEEPGHRSVSWDGRDAAGARVARGVYFCRMQSVGFAAATRIVLLR